MKFLYGHFNLHFLLPVQRYDNFKHNQKHLASCLVTAKLNMAYLPSLKNQQNCCRLHCRCQQPGYSVPPALHCTIWCRSTFGPRGPGLTNFTSFLRPALPILCPVQRYDNFKLKTSKTAHCWCTIAISGTRGTGLSNPTSFLRPALPMAPTTGDNARGK